MIRLRVFSLFFVSLLAVCSCTQGAYAYFEVKEIKSDDGNVQFYRSVGESESPDIELISTQNSIEKRFDFNHDGKVDAVRIQSNGLQISLSWPIQGHYQRLEIRRIEGRIVSDATFFYSDRSSKFELWSFERRPENVFFSGFDDATQNSDQTSAAVPAMSPDIPKTPENSSPSLNFTSYLQKSSAPCSLNTEQGTASQATLELGHQLEIKASNSDPNLQRAVANSCGDLSGDLKSSLATLSETSDRETPPKYLNCLKKIDSLSGYPGIILTKVKNGSDRVTCSENLPLGKRAQISETGEISIKSSSALAAKSSSGLTSLLFHEFLHGEGIEEKQVQEVVACCSQGYDPKNIHCASANLPSGLAPKNALQANANVKLITQELSAKHLERDFEKDLTARLIKSDPKLKCLNVRPSTLACEGLVLVSDEEVSSAVFSTCENLRYSFAAHCDSKKHSGIVGNDPAAKQASQIDLADAIPLNVSSQQSPAATIKMDSIDITKPAQAQKAIADSAPARSIAIANATQSLRSIDAAVLPKAQASEPTTVRSASRTTAPAQSAPAPVASQPAQATSRAQAATAAPAAAPQSAAPTTHKPISTTQREAAPQKPAATGARETTSSPLTAAVTTNAPTTSTTSSQAPTRSSRDSTTSTTSQGAGSGSSAPQTISLVAIGYKDGAPILKVTSSGAQIPTFQAFAGGSAAAGPPQAASGGGSYAPTGGSSESTGRGSLAGGARVRAAIGGGQGSAPQMAANSGGGGGGSGGGFSGAASAAPAGRAASSAPKDREPSASTTERLRNMPVNSASDVVKIVKSAGPEIYSVLNQDWFNGHLKRLSIQIVDGANTYGEKLKPRTRWRLSALIGDDQ